MYVFPRFVQPAAPDLMCTPCYKQFIFGYSYEYNIIVANKILFLINSSKMKCSQNRLFLSRKYQKQKERNEMEMEF